MKISLKLSQFAAQMGSGLSRPLYKFLRDMLTGLVAKMRPLTWGGHPPDGTVFYYRLAEVVALLLLLIPPSRQ